MPAILKLKVDKLLFSRVTKAAESYQALSRAQAEWRIALKDNTKTRDLFSYLLEAKDPESGQSLSQEHLISEAGVLMVAGSDTMATAMAATLFYCVHYPLALQELQEEIRSTFKDIEDVKISDELNRCRYLRACIDESMRLSPSVGGVLPREVLSGGLQIGDDYFPEGTDIGVSSYALHHNEAYYPDPYLFKPERWLADQPGKTGHTSEENVAVAKSAFCPFSVGRASCVGKGLAYQEMSVILARIVWLYDMRLQAGSVRGQGHPHLGRSRDREKEFQMWDGFVSTHKGPLVEFKPRVQVTI